MGKRKGSKQAEQSRLENHAKKMRELRRNESVEQATTRREANSRRMASQREEETDQQCTTRRELDRNRADTRRKPKGNYLAALITIETTIPEEFKCELMDQTCVTCAAKFFKLERNTHNFYTKCCHNGKVALPELGLVPDLFQNLLTTDTAEAKNFKDNIRSYNSSLGFTSMVAKVEMPPGNGPYCYRIHGQVYHAVSSLHPTDKDPCYGQLYILDASEAVDARVGNNPKCLPDLLLKLDTIIREINPYAQAYRNMAEVETEEVEKAEAEGREAREVRMYFKSDASKDQRRYNAPTGNGYSDIAAVFVGDNGEPPQYRDICIYPKTETIKRISVLSQNCDPMSFPLLFPNGETGWTINMEHGGARTNIRDKVTALQFYAYRLAIRDGFSLLHSSGKLFQQYVVNAYCNVEATRLQFIRSNQSLLRVDLYQGLLNHIQTRAVDENVKPGNLVILPSSFNGGPRAQQQRYQDSMAIVRKFGKPDLFITMTCNPLWDEITKSIEPYQLAQNRPDVVARVFNMKLQELLKDLTVRHVFGVPSAYMYSIEF